MENEAIQLVNDLANLVIDQDTVTLPLLKQIPDRFEEESLNNKFIVRGCMKVFSINIYFLIELRSFGTYALIMQLAIQNTG